MTLVVDAMFLSWFGWSLMTISRFRMSLFLTLIFQRVV